MDGVGASVKRTEAIMREENYGRVLFWALRIHVHLPMLFFANEKNLCLHGSREHNVLKLSV